MNWMAYFANHGLDSIAPGPGQWMNPARYDEMTNNIVLMGQYMSTDPNDGTTGGGAMAGLATWLPMWCFVVSHYYTSFWWSPDFDDIAHRGMSGSYIIPVVGWYDDLDDVRIDRIGPRPVPHPLREAGTTGNFAWRDPGSDENNLNSQSLYTSESYG